MLAAFAFASVEIVLGLLQIFCGRDLFLDEQLGPVVCRLVKFDLRRRGAVGVLEIVECLEIIGFGLVDVGGFEIGELLAFANDLP